VLQQNPLVQIIFARPEPLKTRLKPHKFHPLNINDAEFCHKMLWIRGRYHHSISLGKLGKRRLPGPTFWRETFIKNTVDTTIPNVQCMYRLKLLQPFCYAGITFLMRCMSLNAILASKLTQISSLRHRSQPCVQSATLNLGTCILGSRGGLVVRVLSVLATKTTDPGSNSQRNDMFSGRLQALWKSWQL